MSTRRIFVADDEPAMRQLIRMALEALPDVDLRLFDNGLDLLRAVQESPPDLIVSDIMLPRLEGLAVARLLKFHETYEGIPFVVISSVIDRDIEQQVQEVRADAYLRKPFRSADLCQKIKALLARSGAST